MSGYFRKLGGAALMLSLGLFNSGCIKKILLDGQIASTRQASAAVSSISDYHVAKAAGEAGLAQFEGLHYLAPGNRDGLFILTKSWASVSFAFMEDEMQQAEDEHGEDSELAAYHRARAAAAYSRSIFYGIKLLEMDNPGFEAATKNSETIQAWLKGFDDAEEHTATLMWVGQAWMGRVNLMKDRSEYVGDLFIGMNMVKRALALNPEYNYGTPHVILGAYHARAAFAELDESKKHFEEALRISEGKALLVKLNYATRYYCVKVDKENYVKLLTEVLEAGDVLPKQRLQNTIAKRRARRFLSKKRMAACGFE